MAKSNYEDALLFGSIGILSGLILYLAAFNPQTRVFVVGGGTPDNKNKKSAYTMSTLESPWSSQLVSGNVFYPQ